jgi:hypothetical protein
MTFGSTSAAAQMFDGAKGVSSIEPSFSPAAVFRHWHRSAVCLAPKCMEF